MKVTKRVKWSDSDKNVLINYYPIGGATKCQKLLSTKRSYKCIGKKARELGLTFHNNWSETEINLLKEFYPTATSDELKIIFPNRKREHLNCKARELGIKCLVSRTNNSSGSLDFLDNLNSESVYWWGFILGDGHISVKNGLIISLDKSDVDHLSYLAKKLNIEIKRSRSNNIVTISISRKSFSEKWVSLLNLHNSSKTYYPPSINVFNGFYKELIVGLIDADGHIRYKRNHYSCSIELHKSWYQILIQIQNILLNDYHINSTVKFTKKNKMVRIVIGNKKNIKKLKELSYGLPYLKRKWDIIKL